MQGNLGKMKYKREKGGGKKERENNWKQNKNVLSEEVWSQRDSTNAFPSRKLSFSPPGADLLVAHRVTPAFSLLASLISIFKLSNKKRNSHDHSPPFWLQNLHTWVVLSTPQEQAQSFISHLPGKAMKSHVIQPWPTPARLPGAQSCLESYQKQDQRGLKLDRTPPNPELNF